MSDSLFICSRSAAGARAAASRAAVAVVATVATVVAIAGVGLARAAPGAGVSAPPPAAGGQVTLDVSLDPAEVAAGERARVQMTVSWDGPADAYAIESWGAPEVGGVPLLAESDQVQTDATAGRTVTRRRAVYPVRGEIPGTLALSPARVVLRDSAGRSRPYAGRALGLTVVPAPSRVPFVDVALVLAGLGLAGVVVRAARGARPPPPVPDRSQKARARVDALAAVGHRDHREFYEACIEALRAGLAEEWAIQVRERDRAKVVRLLAEAGFARERCQAVEELLALCDEARFNPEAPPESVRSRAMTLLASVLSD
jgi:hypothetical protein